VAAAVVEGTAVGGRSQDDNSVLSRDLRIGIFLRSDVYCVVLIVARTRIECSRMRSDVN
jgi:hypothetical protein